MLTLKGLAERGKGAWARERLLVLVSDVSDDLAALIREAVLRAPHLEPKVVCRRGRDEVLLRLYELGADIRIAEHVRDSLLVADDLVLQGSSPEPLASRDPTRLETALTAFERAYRAARRWEPNHLPPSQRVVELLNWIPPEESASFRLSRWQATVLVLAGCAAVGAAALHPFGFLLAVTGLGLAFYLVNLAYKLALIAAALMGRPEVRVTDEELKALSYDQLPVYSVLVPLYREAEVVLGLVEALMRMDYPKEKMDVQFLVERDDSETLRVLQSLRLPDSFRVRLVPDLYPRTKPKACQFGLLKARGRYLVIYDAEDIPDPDQLKVAVAAFRKAGPRVACLQAKLNYHNKNWNLLTRLFTAEYSTWFGLYLPGLMRLNAPIPLGGTSNHFRVDVLREIGGWDPFNVTEDCDLGIRLHRRGWRTRVIDSTTWEEANSELRNWLRQRSRWVKGYIQTYFVHTRSLGRWARVPVGDTLGFHMMVFGTFFALLINPVYWGVSVLWLATRWELIPALYPGVVGWLAAFCLIVGNGFFIVSHVAGVVRAGFYDLVPYVVFLMPVYWALMSVAAYKGLMQFVYTPHYWEKRRHGLRRGGWIG
jgi:cellulose synthase/poly-beta-1,6-N-acetylglucosamine synthase-like glycosyltransferase